MAKTPSIPWESIEATPTYIRAEQGDREKIASNYFDRYLANTQAIRGAAGKARSQAIAEGKAPIAAGEAVREGARKKFLERITPTSLAGQTVKAGWEGLKLGGSQVSAGLTDLGLEAAQAPQNIAGAIQSGMFGKGRVVRAPQPPQIQFTPQPQSPTQGVQSIPIPSPSTLPPMTPVGLQQSNLQQFGEAQQRNTEGMQRVAGANPGVLPSTAAVVGQVAPTLPVMIGANMLIPGSGLAAGMAGDALGMAAVSPGNKLMGAVTGAGMGGATRVARQIPRLKAPTQPGWVATEAPSLASAPPTNTAGQIALRMAAQRAVQAGGFGAVTGAMGGSPEDVAKAAMLGGLMPVGKAPIRPQPIPRFTPDQPLGPANMFPPTPNTPWVQGPILPRAAQAGREDLINLRVDKMAARDRGTPQIHGQSPDMNPLLGQPYPVPPARQLPLLPTAELPLGAKVTPNLPINPELPAGTGGDVQSVTGTPENLTRNFQIETGPDGKARVVDQTIPSGSVEGNYTPDDVAHAMRLAEEARLANEAAEWAAGMGKGGQKLLPAPEGTRMGPGAAPAAAPEPAGKQPWEMRREEYVGTRQPERHDFAAGILASVEQSGAQGLSSAPKNYGVGKVEVQGHEIVYRDNNGIPVAVARLVPVDGALAVKDFATDKTRGALGARAAVAVGREIERLGAAQPSGTMSPDAAKLQHHRQVQQAAERGDPVPRAVLADYAGEEWADAALAALPSGETPPRAGSAPPSPQTPLPFRAPEPELGWKRQPAPEPPQAPKPAVDWMRETKPERRGSSEPSLALQPNRQEPPPPTPIELARTRPPGPNADWLNQPVPDSFRLPMQMRSDPPLPFRLSSRLGESLPANNPIMKKMGLGKSISTANIPIEGFPGVGPNTFYRSGHPVLPSTSPGGHPPTTPVVFSKQQTLGTIPSDPAASAQLDELSRLLNQADDIEGSTDAAPSPQLMGLVAPGLDTTLLPKTLGKLRGSLPVSMLSTAASWAKEVGKTAGQGSLRYLASTSPAGARLAEALNTAFVNDQMYAIPMTVKLIKAIEGSGQAKKDYWHKGEFGKLIRSGKIMEITDPGVQAAYAQWRAAARKIAEDYNFVTRGKAVKVGPHLNMEAIATLLGKPDLASSPWRAPGRVAEELGLKPSRLSDKNWQEVADLIKARTGTRPLKEAIAAKSSFRPLDPDWEFFYPQVLSRETRQAMKDRAAFTRTKQYDEFRKANPEIPEDELWKIASGKLYTPEFAGFYGTLERPQRITYPDSWLEPNDIKVMENYIKRASNRLWEVSQFGNEQTAEGLGGKKFRMLLKQMQEEDPEGWSIPVGLAENIYGGLFLRPEMLGKLGSALNFAQNFTVASKMINLFVTPLQLTSQGNTVTAFNYLRTMKATYDILFSPKRGDLRRQVRQSGAVGQDWMRNFTEIMDQGRFSAFNRTALKLQGTTAMDMEMRLIAGRAGLSWLHDAVDYLKESKAGQGQFGVVRSNARKIKEGALLRTAERIGISRERMQGFVDSGLTQTNLNEFAQLAVRFTQFVSDPLSRPVWGHSAVAKASLTLMNFAIHQSRFAFTQVGGELAHGNPFPLIRFLSSWGLAGEGYTALRNHALHKDRNDTDWKDIKELAKQGELADAAREAGERWLHNLMAVSSIGITMDLLKFGSQGVNLTTERLTPVFLETITGTVASAAKALSLLTSGEPATDEEAQTLGQIASDWARREFVLLDRIAQSNDYKTEGQIMYQKRDQLGKAADYFNMGLDWNRVVSEWNENAKIWAHGDLELQRKSMIDAQDLRTKIKELRED